MTSFAYSTTTLSLNFITDNGDKQLLHFLVHESSTLSIIVIHTLIPTPIFSKKFKIPTTPVEPFKHIMEGGGKIKI